MRLNPLQSGWKWGEPPPAWFMRHVKEALTLMSRNNEAVHLFGISDEWSRVIGLAAAPKGDTLLRIINHALSGHVIDSRHYFPDAPMQATAEYLGLTP